MLCPCGDRALESQQARTLAPVEPGQRPAMRSCVLRPFGGIHVDEIDEHGQAGFFRHIVGHDGREDHGMVDRLRGAGPCDPGLQAGIAVIRQGQRFATQQPAQAAQLGPARRQARHMHVDAVASHLIEKSRVRRIVDEGAEEEPMPLGQMLHQVEGAHLVALVGRIGQAVDEIQQVGHAVQPRLRTISGPSRLATQSGRRRHVAISSLYFGLFGLFCGIASRL